MNIKKYQAFDDEDLQEGFQKNPEPAEIVIQSPQNHSHWKPYYSIISEKNKTKHRYSNSEKPVFKLKPLEDTRYKSQKASGDLINKSSFHTHEVREEMEDDGTSDFTLPRKNKKVVNNSVSSHLEELMQSVVIKTKRAEVAENIPIDNDHEQQEQMITEQFSKNPDAKVVYRSGVLQSTHTIFKKFMKSSCQPCFIQSKYNLALKIKMQKVKPAKEEQEKNTEQKTSSNLIEFQGDFQSGNLDFVTKISQTEYNVHLRIDTNTRGHRSWFYFKLINHHIEMKKIRINICNISRKFRLVQNGQKVFIQTVNPFTPWQALEEVVELELFNKKKFQLSFQLGIKANQQIFLSLIPPYTYSKLLKDVEQFEKSPNVKVDILSHSITGLAVPILTISKGAARQRKVKQASKKKLFLISGRIHPSETCSSYIINGLIKDLLIDSQQNEQFLSQNVIKIIPMLNPDGVVFGNFRTNYLGDDLNRSFYKNDHAIYPETTALKELGKALLHEYGDNFIGFLDMHGHSGQTNSFIYGPQHEEKSQSFLECRIFPKILDKTSKYFKYDMSQFKLEQYKFNTARGFFLKKLKVPAYTIQTSYALYRDKNNPEEKPKLMGILQWQELGHQIAHSLHSYSRYLQLSKPSVVVFRKQKNRNAYEKREREDWKNHSCFDFSSLKKEIQQQIGSEKKRRNTEQESEDSDGQNQEEDLPSAEKIQILRKFKESASPNFLLPKVTKPSLPLHSVVPSILDLKKSEDKITPQITKFSSKYRNKKLVRPMNFSYEYTQYLLKNISQMGSLRPDVINFGFANKRTQNLEGKNRSTISEV